MFRIVSVLACLTVFMAPRPGAAQIWNRTTGPVVYQGTVRGEITTDQDASKKLDDLEIGGVTIAKGETLGVSLAAANRDPAVYPDPDRFDVTRNPTDHLAFGRGVHRCVGAGLAQEEVDADVEHAPFLAERVERGVKARLGVGGCAGHHPII